MCLDVASGQIYQFENAAVPAKSLSMVFSFYVYSFHDAPEKSLGQPFVKFHNVVAHSPGATALPGYRGMQLSLVPLQTFWTLVDPQHLCTTEADRSAGRAQEIDQLLVKRPEGVTQDDMSVYTHTVEFGQEHPKDVSLPVRATGIYVLVFSNCGSLPEATLTGSVVVKNAYGFLPGIEYHKLTFYGSLTSVYGLLALVWMAASIRWWKESFTIQNCISVVIFFGLVEAFMGWFFYHDWNINGVRNNVLFTFLTLFAVLKSTFSYTLVLVASLGWGVTRPYLDQQTTVRILALSVLNLVLSFLRETFLSYRHSHRLSPAFMVLCLLPSTVLNAITFFWIFTALSSLIATLRERRQMEKLILFQRLWRLLVGAIVSGSFMFLFQIFDLSRSINTKWKYQWFLADGVTHTLFLVVLAVMMFLWAPNIDSSRYTYVAPKNRKGGDKGPKTTWEDVDDRDEDSDDDEDFWAATQGSSEAKASSSNAKAVTGLSTKMKDIEADADGEKA